VLSHYASTREEVKSNMERDQMEDLLADVLVLRRLLAQMNKRSVDGRIAEADRVVANFELDLKRELQATYPNAGGESFAKLQLSQWEHAIDLAQVTGEALDDVREDIKNLKSRLDDITEEVEDQVTRTESVLTRLQDYAEACKEDLEVCVEEEADEMPEV